MLLPLSFIGLLAVCLLAAATPRQASELFTPPLPHKQQILLRAFGFLLLAASFFVGSLSHNAGRLLIAHIGLLGLYAAIISLGCTLWLHNKKRRDPAKRRNNHT
ncbi:DUF3325 family protein [Acetobacter indonesiensis]|uniref:DUF3325 family protein n=1 Tax=Acetobacter indonesiensis TaxID=104101 RepID=UPI0039ED06F7